MRHCLLLALFVLACATCYAQTTAVVEGTVTDAESGSAIGGATVRVVDIGKRTYASSAGRFRLPLTAGTYRITISSIGYHDTSISVTLAGDPVRLAVALRPASIRGQVVEVTAELSADQIIQRAIQRKNENRQRAKTVQGLLYSKMSFDVQGNTFGKLADKDRQGILETFSRMYFSERGTRMVVIQRRQTANIPAESNLMAMATFISFYDDDLQVLNATIPSPLNASTLSRYRFELKERSMLNGQIVYVIGVHAATKLLPTFEGTIKIVAANYTLIDVDLRPSATTAISFVRDLRLRQKFDRLENDIWEPTFLEVTGRARVELLRGFADIDAGLTATSFFTELQVNAPIPDSVYNTEAPVTAAPNADSSRPEFWEGNSLSELSAEEKTTYRTVDSLVAIADTTGNSNGDYGIPISISPHIVFNRVESITAGLNLGLRLGAVGISTMGAYSFGMRRPVGSAELSVNILNLPDDPIALSVSGRVFSEAAVASADRGYPTIINSVLAALVHRDYMDYMRADGWSATAVTKVDRLTFQAVVGEARQSPLANTTSRSIFLHEPFRANPMADRGEFRVVDMSLLWGNPAFTVSIGSAAGTDLGASLRGFYGQGTESGTHFRGVEGSLTFSTPTIGTGYMPMMARFTARGGTASGDVPPQYQFRLHTSTAFVGITGVLYSAPVGLYGGTRYAAFSAEHNFGDIAWRALGLPTYEGRGIEISLSAATAIAENSMDHGYQATNGNWYSEVGFGIGRIPTFVSNVIYLGFDARWGLGPLGANRFGWVLSLSSPF